jgi:hypothetical protein
MFLTFRLNVGAAELQVVLAKDLADMQEMAGVVGHMQKVYP